MMLNEQKENDLRYLASLPIHFIFCTERTGSSMLTGMFNQIPEVLCTSEQLFALYFYKKYGQKTKWNEEEITRYVNEFVLMFERNLKMFYSDPLALRDSLLKLKDDLNYQLLIRVTYFHFLDLKNKSKISVFIDKQITFLYYPELVKKIFPDAKILLLTRDVRDNIVSRVKRKFNKSRDYHYLAGIWNDTFRNVNKMQKLYPGNFQVLRYEDLVSDPETELKRACDFFGIAYYNEMLQYHETFEKFLQAKKETVGDPYIDWVRDVHGSMLKPVSTDKIGNWQKEIDNETAAEIAFACRETGQYLGYDFSKPYQPKEPGVIVKMKLFKAKCDRYYLLRVYMRIPINIKLFIKRIKGKKVYIT